MFFCPAFLMVSTGWNPQNGSQNLRSSQNEAAVKPPDDGWPCSQKIEVEVFMDVSFWMFHNGFCHSKPSKRSSLDITTSCW